MRISILRSIVVLALLLRLSHADGPADNRPDQVRPIPPAGIEVAQADRQRLLEELGALEQQIAELKSTRNRTIASLVPDIEIYYRAVHDALTYQEFFRERDVAAAFGLLAAGKERAEQLLHGEAPWTESTGLVVRGYVSRIDGSVQPYGLVIPDSYSHHTPQGYRLDIWFHGRGETLSEVNFLAGRSRRTGQFAPQGTIVLHPYGRYSNAFRFAGEVDVLEALESVRTRYRIDEDRISVRGFSMGGAACWQFAVHYADRWFAANPGAGFSETRRFLTEFQQENLQPTWFEEKLWQLYDCDLLVRNLLHCPTVAYSGEIDRQKRAADIMAEALANEGVELTHVIGPQTGHRYHPDAAAEVSRRLDSLAKRGREGLPHRVTLTTYTLKYHRMHWITLDALEEHWRAARVDAVLDDQQVVLETRNVTDLTLDIPAGSSPPWRGKPARIVVDGQPVGTIQPQSDLSWHAPLHRAGGTWQLGARQWDGLRKRHGLQGPIDDAFMDSFIFVRPTGAAWHPAVGSWSDAELERAIEHWRRHFRGHARVMDDRVIGDEEIAAANLVLWGDPASNGVLGQIIERLPIQWTRNEIAVGQRRFPSHRHAVVAIYPNPLNPDRYVVLNTSFTFREYAYLNNARQTPKLPDWAVIDLETPAGTVWPGKIADADFFDERWQLKPPH